MIKDQVELKSAYISKLEDNEFELGIFYDDGYALAREYLTLEEIRKLRDWLNKYLDENNKVTATKDDEESE
jgi:hypothetical protein